MSENFAEGKNVFLGNKIEAVYNHEEEAMYKHNAFIEALPYVRSEERVASLIRRKPAYDEKERLYSAHRRLQLVQTIANFIEPLPV
ncbi:hypothetical protein, partial [Acinetobacter baumannii]|uniref:hypothetical protein n=1 Tax=Acinetobacter baumannii TaxID=470 RepID=UPI000A467339